MAISTCANGCGEVFKSATSFDRHLRVIDTQRGTLLCMNPEEVGLVRDKVAGKTSPWRRADVSAKRQPERLTRKCRDCDRMLTPTGKKGRPAVRCRFCKAEFAKQERKQKSIKNAERKCKHCGVKMAPPKGRGRPATACVKCGGSSPTWGHYVEARQAAKDAGLSVDEGWKDLIDQIARRVKA